MSGRYLGVELSHVTAEQAYGKVISKMLLRSRYISMLPLTLKEKAAVLKIWVALCGYVTSRVYPPSSSVVRQQNVVQSVALGLNSWGLTRGILCEIETLGGISLAPLGSYALYIPSQAFVKYVHGTTPGGVRTGSEFAAWANVVGLVLVHDMLPFIRLAPRVRQPPGHLGTSCVA